MYTSSIPKNDTNNLRLRQLLEQTGLEQEPALALFNVGMPKKYSLSVWKAYLSDPASVRWRRLHPDLLAHAEKTIGKISKSG